MEWLPHEVRFLYNSVVVYRYPDRLIPPGDLYFDWVERLGRGAQNIIPGEFDAADELIAPSWYATITQNFFLAHKSDRNLGFWDNAAHHLVDYVKVWDVPKDVFIPDFPH